MRIITWGDKISKAMKGKNKGKNNPSYKDGRTLKKYYCKTLCQDCHNLTKNGRLNKCLTKKNNKLI